MSNLANTVDSESTHFLNQLAGEEKIRELKVAGVKVVLVVLSSRGMVFDRAALEQKIHLTYPSSKVYFYSTLAIPLSEVAPEKIDLLIDFTGPSQRRKWFFARHLRSRTKVTVGRNAGFFRAYIYDRVFDEFKEKQLPKDLLERERFAQREVLRLAGVPLSQKGELLQDLGKEVGSEFARAQKHA